MARSTRTLLNGWSWRQVETDNWTKCSHYEPTSNIHMDLMASDIIGDPFVDMNEETVQWVGEVDWEYQCEFILDPKQLADFSHQDLIFHGLDTFAKAYVNEVEVLSSENMFHSHRVDVSKYLEPGVNILRIQFDSPVRISKQLEASHKKLASWNGDSWRLYARKAQYHFGWDWGEQAMIRKYFF